MRFQSGMILALSAGLLLSGCAGAAGAGGGPARSPTGREYAPGTPPSQTRFSQSATLALAQGQYEQAMTQSREGIASNPENPQHYLLAGEAAVGLGDFVLADSMWTAAETIYPAYELEIEPAREAAWADAFNEGVEAYNSGNTQAAIEAWSNADMIYPYRPEAAQNLAILLTQEGEYQTAIDTYRSALTALETPPATRELEPEEIAEREEAEAFMLENLAQLLLYTDQFAEAERLLRRQLEAKPDDVELQANLANALGRQGREAEAAEIYNRLLSGSNLNATQLFNIGVSLFNSNEYVRAAEAFGRVAQLVPNSRDAWYNQANALYAAEEWTALLPIAGRLVELDPLNENAGLILARAHRELEQNQEALAALERIQSLPVYLEELQLRPSGDQTTIAGRVVGNAAPQGSTVRLRFTFYGETGQTTETATITAPAAEQSAPFELTVAAPAEAYSYELLP